MKSEEINIRVSELQKYSLFVATPMYGGNCTGIYTSSLLKLQKICQHHSIDMECHFIFNESLIPRARNYLCDEFMRSKYTHMMFIDADIGFDPYDVLRLMGLQIGNPSEYNVIGAVYPKKAIAWEKILAGAKTGAYDANPSELRNLQADFVLNGTGNQKITVNEVSEIRHIGTGFMLIPKTTFKVFTERYKCYSYLPDHARSDAFDGSREIMQFFHSEIHPEHRIYLSEDYWFCEKLRDIGMKIWFCPWMSDNLQHVGSHIFSGSLSAMSDAKVSATTDINKLKN